MSMWNSAQEILVLSVGDSQARGPDPVMPCDLSQGVTKQTNRREESSPYTRVGYELHQEKRLDPRESEALESSAFFMAHVDSCTHARECQSLSGKWNRKIGVFGGKKL